jgi:hypothetical protein
MREAIRRRRSAMISDLLDNLFKGSHDVPSLEFARNKYDAKPTTANGAGDATRHYRVRTLVLFVSALPYLLFSLAGFVLLMEPIANLVAAKPEDGWLRPTLFWATKGDVDSANLVWIAALAGAAFLGGYLFTLRNLLKAVLNFELNPITWLRAAIHLLSGVVVTVLVYRALADTSFLKSLVDSIQVPGLWLAFAFFVGFMPDLGLTTAARYVHIHYLKTIDDTALKSVSIVPIEVVDGIDYDTRYRLEEANIIDVQNLATYNPILLFVETPYGLYESFDWVLQAQLCLVTGPKTFLELKRHNIRTIFDLERAVLADTATDGYVRMIGNILYANADPEMRKLIAAGAVGPAAPTLDVPTVKHAVMVMLDDLHIHRLRQLWIIICGKLSAEWLYRSEPMMPAARAGQQEPAKRPAGRTLQNSG